MKRIISMVLSLLLVITFVGGTNVNAAVVKNDQKTEEKSNYNFLMGNPGEQDLVYTYESNGDLYKVVEHATENFDKVESVIYKADDNGNFNEWSKQILTIQNNTLTLATIKNDEVLVEVQDYTSMAQDAMDTTDNKAVTQGISSRETYMGYTVTGWQYVSTTKGSNKFTNYTITAVTAAVTFIVTDGLTGGTGAAAAAISAVVSKIIDERLTNVYYSRAYYEKKLVNPPISLRNFVVASKWVTKFYEDKAHKKYINTVTETVYAK